MPPTLPQWRPATSQRGRLRLPLRTALAVLALLTLTVAAAPGVRGQQNPGVIVRGSYLMHRVTLQDGYGESLSERYDAQYIDMRGTGFSLTAMLTPEFGVGGEFAQLEGGFTYETLNGDEQSADFGLSWRAVRADLMVAPQWRLAGGLGQSRLTRELYGYTDESITTENVDDNSGQEELETTAPLTFGEVAWVAHGRNVGLELGLRYTVSVHSIDADDERPAYDDKGRPVASEFDLSGFAYVLSLAVLF